jgi:hypothetical protein
MIAIKCVRVQRIQQYGAEVSCDEMSLITVILESDVRGNSVALVLSVTVR